MSTFHLIPLMTLVTRDTLDRLSEIIAIFLTEYSRTAMPLPYLCAVKQRRDIPRQLGDKNSLTGEFILPNLTAKNRFRELERKLFTNKKNAKLC